MGEIQKTKNNEVVKKINPIDATLAQVQNLMETGDLKLPDGYNVENAMKSAKLMLEGIKNKNGEKALQVCTRVSIYNSLMLMAIQGLNPAKNQCYLIMYGDELTLIRSYFGTELVVKRIMGDPKTPINTRVVYEGDTLDISIDDFGMTNITNHVTTLENIKKGVIVGAYCKIYDLAQKDEKGNPKLVACEYMDIEEIKKSWTMSKTYKFGNSVHTKYAGEMAKRTVIARTCKHIVNNSNDDNLASAFNETTKNEFKNVTPKQVRLSDTGAKTLEEKIKYQKQVAEALENEEETTTNNDYIVAEDGEIIEEKTPETPESEEDKLEEIPF